MYEIAYFGGLVYIVDVSRQMNIAVFTACSPRTLLFYTKFHKRSVRARWWWVKTGDFWSFRHNYPGNGTIYGPGYY